MATSNDGSPRDKPGAAKPSAMPALTAVRGRRVQYRAPRRFVTAGREHTAAEVIEIDVETDAEFPVAGTGPALFIGDVVVADSERVGERRYRFFAPGTTRLKEGAPIALGRAGSGAARPEQRTKLRFRWGGGPTSSGDDPIGATKPPGRTPPSGGRRTTPDRRLDKGLPRSGGIVVRQDEVTS